MFAVVLVVLAARFLLVKFLEAPLLEAFLVFGSFHSGFLNNFLSRLLLLAFCSLCAFLLFGELVSLPLSKQRRSLSRFGGLSLVT